MLRQAQHEDVVPGLTLSLSKGEAPVRAAASEAWPAGLLPCNMAAIPLEMAMSEIPEPSGKPVNPASNLPELTVSELAHRVKAVVEDQFGLVRVRGEISKMTRPASGHLYLTLKDDKAVLESVCWRGTVGRIGVLPQEGSEVVCVGRLTTYPGRSQYQLIIERIELAGIGALMALLDQRRRKLMAEGLFAAERKRPLPYLPAVVGVITSPTGAVIHDILHRLRERFPRHVLLWPVAVQGAGAAEQVAAAIAGFNRLVPGGAPPRPDVLIVARGGGSIEDLWAFNEEIVVRAAAASAIPLISAVGHETDTTLIDFASDRRAPTPTAAAEMAVPVRLDLMADLTALAQRLDRGVRRWLADRRTAVLALARGLRGPRQALHLATQRLDDIGSRLPRALAAAVRARAARLDAAAAGLRPALLRRDLGERRRRLDDLSRALPRAWGRRFKESVTALGERARVLESLSYRRTLERGFAVLRAEGGHPIVTAAAARPGMAVDIEFKDGHRGARIAGQAGDAGAKPKRSRSGGGEQGSLL
jgi:exodeoxyribonuclease VII large subunit